MVFCRLIDSVYVAVREVYCNLDSIVIPTAFTPNFDGVNDTYKIKNNGVDIVSFNISIYNRLGQLVFNSNDINFSGMVDLNQSNYNLKYLIFLLK